MLAIKCIKQVEQELKIIESEIERSSINNNADYLRELKSNQKKLKEILENYCEIIKTMPSIENRLYYRIAYLGENPTQAIRKVAEENYLKDRKPTDVTYIFKKIYPKIKKYLIFEKNQ